MIFYQQNLLSITPLNVLNILSAKPAQHYFIKTPLLFYPQNVLSITPSNVLTILSAKRAQLYFIKRAQNFLGKTCSIETCRKLIIATFKPLTVFQANLLKPLHQKVFFFSLKFFLHWFVRRCNISFPKSTWSKITIFEETNPKFAIDD